jgi:hypothetical protein
MGLGRRGLFGGRSEGEREDDGMMGRRSMLVLSVSVRVDC